MASNSGLLPFKASVGHQSMRISLDGVTYVVDMHWNEREGAWYLDLSDSTESRIASGMKVIANAPLLAKVVDARRPPGEIIALDQTGNDVDDPGFDDLNIRVKLLYVAAADR
jgi:hypothetical protein